ncbi:MAG: iron-binding protein, partial [Verrucomicrobiales bacterium]|nr:iron-binding protein [Verrucomicrobiales bacterium]
MSEYGEPLSWEVEGGLDAKETVRLCGCGKSKKKPYCDQTHNMVDF